MNGQGYYQQNMYNQNQQNQQNNNIGMLNNQNLQYQNNIQPKFLQNQGYSTNQMQQAYGMMNNYQSVQNNNIHMQNQMYNNQMMMNTQMGNQKMQPQQQNSFNQMGMGMMNQNFNNQNTGNMMQQQKHQQMGMGMMMNQNFNNQNNMMQQQMGNTNFNPTGKKKRTKNTKRIRTKSTKTKKTKRIKRIKKGKKNKKVKTEHTPQVMNGYINQNQMCMNSQNPYGNMMNQQYVGNMMNKQYVGNMNIMNHPTNLVQNPKMHTTAPKIMISKNFRKIKKSINKFFKEGDYINEFEFNGKNPDSLDILPERSDIALKNVDYIAVRIEAKNESKTMPIDYEHETINYKVLDFSSEMVYYDLENMRIVDIYSAPQDERRRKKFRNKFLSDKKVYRATNWIDLKFLEEKKVYSTLVCFHVLSPAYSQFEIQYNHFMNLYNNPDCESFGNGGESAKELAAAEKYKRKMETSYRTLSHIREFEGRVDCYYDDGKKDKEIFEINLKDSVRKNPNGTGLNLCLVYKDLEKGVWKIRALGTTYIENSFFQFNIPYQCISKQSKGYEFFKTLSTAKKDLFENCKNATKPYNLLNLTIDFGGFQKTVKVMHYQGRKVKLVIKKKRFLKRAEELDFKVLNLDRLVKDGKKKTNKYSIQCTVIASNQKKVIEKCIKENESKIILHWYKNKMVMVKGALMDHLVVEYPEIISVKLSKKEVKKAPNF